MLEDRKLLEEIENFASRINHKNLINEAIGNRILPRRDGFTS